MTSTPETSTTPPRSVEECLTAMWSSAVYAREMAAQGLPDEADRHVGVLERLIGEYRAARTAEKAQTVKETAA